MTGNGFGAEASCRAANAARVATLLNMRARLRKPSVSATSHGDYMIARPCDYTLYIVPFRTSVKLLPHGPTSRSKPAMFGWTSVFVTETYC